MNEKPVIQIKDIRKVYQMGTEKVVALNRINADIMANEFCCIFGTSGSGKSTLLNLLGGMEKPTFGSILLLGQDITKMSEKNLAVFRQKHIGFIFQSYNLLPELTAVENVAMPLMFQGMDKKRREIIAKEMLKRVGLSNRLTHYPGQMSGGQQQRVGIARAFITRPQIIFADEPTGNLDTKTTQEVMQMMKEFAALFQQTVVMVTHDPGMEQYASRAIHMCDGHIINDTQKQQLCQTA